MKQTFNTIFLLMAIACLGLTLTSCTDDEDIAYYLAGKWEGEIDDGEDVYQVTFYFNQSDDYSASGTGWEYDNGWFSSSETPFHWAVRNEQIIIQYDDYSGVRVVLDSNVPLSRYDDHMEGYIVNDYTGEDMAQFYLNQVYGNSKQDSFDAEKE